MSEAQTQEITTPFVVGAEVAVEVHRGWGRKHGWRTAKIAKVHKNARFILDGEDGQWTPSQNTFGNWSATKPKKAKGRDRHFEPTPMLRPMSDEIRIEMGAISQMEANVKIIRQMERILSGSDGSDVKSSVCLKKAFASLEEAMGK